LRIDRLLLRQSYRSVAGQFGISESACYRHGKDHLPLRLLSAAADDEQATAATVLNDLRGLKAVGNVILKRAMGSGDLVVALRAVGELRNLLSTTLKAVETHDLETRLAVLEASLQQRKQLTAL
jgi:hypothetical protein